ncbi:hypothetical protein NQ317_011391, partial [Molorchus minor]
MDLLQSSNTKKSINIPRFKPLFSEYKVLDKIGEEVLKFQNRDTGICYAAKRLKKVYKTEASIMSCAEIIAAQKLPYHPNILNMLQYHYDNFTGKVTFIFELMDMSMHDYLKTKRRGLSEHRVKNYLYQMLQGLDHLHKHGLFHRDVKPENILLKFPSILYHPLSQASSREIIKLADLGSVRGIYSSPPYTEYISTRWYRSPECLLTIGQYGPKMDVWAAGCVFFEMLTLRPLFPGSNEIDQLSKIHQIVGSPSIQFLGRLRSRSRNCIFFPKLKGTGVDMLCPFITRNGRNLLRLMIEYDPDKRSNVKRLLRNCYFDDIRVTYEMSFAKYQPQIRNSSWYRQNESLKRSMGDDGSFNNRGLVKTKMMKRDHYCPDELGKCCKETPRTKHGIINSSHEMPFFGPQRPLVLNKANLSNHKTSSLPVVDNRTVNPVNYISKNVTQNRLVKTSSLKKKQEGRFLKTTSNLDTIKHDMDVKNNLKHKLHSKSFIIPRKMGQHKIHTINDKEMVEFQKKKVECAHVFYCE